MTVSQNQLNPTITPQEVESQLTRHLELDLNHRHTQFYRTTNEEVLFQGDVVKLPYKLKRKVGSEYALLLSNTCDMTRDREQRVLHLNYKTEENQVDNLKRSTRGNLFRHYNEGKKRGVVKYKSGKYEYWRAIINKDQKTITVGYFKNKEEAETAYRLAYAAEYGELPW